MSREVSLESDAEGRVRHVSPNLMLDSTTHESFRSNKSAARNAPPAHSATWSPSGVAARDGVRGTHASPHGGSSRAPLASADSYQSVQSSASNMTNDGETTRYKTFDALGASAAARYPEESFEEEGEDEDTPLKQVPGIKHWQSVPDHLNRPRMFQAYRLGVYDPTDPSHNDPLPRLEDQYRGDSGISTQLSVSASQTGNSGIGMQAAGNHSASMSNISRLSTSGNKIAVIIMHVDADTETARKFKKLVKKSCNKLEIHLETWDDRCVAGLPGKKIKDSILRHPAVLFFLVTPSFLTRYERRNDNTKTLSNIVFDVLHGALDSDSGMHFVVPVIQKQGVPPEEKVASIFPETKSIKLEDRDVKKNIERSIKQAGVVKKRGMWKRLSLNFSQAQLNSSGYEDLV